MIASSHNALCLSHGRLSSVSNLKGCHSARSGLQDDSRVLVEQIFLALGFIYQGERIDGSAHVHTLMLMASFLQL